MKHLSIIFLSIVCLCQIIVAQDIPEIPGVNNEDSSREIHIDSTCSGEIKYTFNTEEDVRINHPSYYQITIFDSSGLELFMIDFDENKQRTRFTKSIYNEADQLEKLIHSKSDVPNTWQDEYYYDMFGNLIETVNYNSSGEISSQAIDYYDPSGIKLKSETIGPAGNLTFINSYKFNENKQPVEIEMRTASGFLILRTISAYNEMNLLSLKTMYLGASGKKNEYHYNYNDSTGQQTILEFNDGKLKTINKIFKIDRNIFAFAKDNGFILDDLEIETPSKESKNFIYKSLAEFPGGNDALVEYIHKNITYPVISNKSGVVIVGFTIENDGNISEIEIKRGLSSKIDKRVVDAFAKMPKWIPTIASDGSPVRSSMAIPIVFYKN